jgi:nucleoid-associated protein YgaU
MGLFGKSFEEKVSEALEQVKAKVPGLKGFGASVEGKVVTLTGHAPTKEAKLEAGRAFNALVETENTVNAMRVEEAPAAEAAAAPPAGAAAPPAGSGRIHQVKMGDTLSGIAKTYYGKASLYMKIFEANRDQLDNPDLIKVGQKLRIPD